MARLSRTQEYALHSVAQRMPVDWAMPQTIQSLIRRGLVSPSDPDPGHYGDPGLRLTRKGLETYRNHRLRQLDHVCTQAKAEFELCLTHAERNTMKEAD